MKKRHSQQSWQLEVSRAKDANERRELMQKLSRGEIEVVDDSGHPISFAPPPDRLGPSPLPFPSQRDSYATAPKSDAAQVTKSFSLGDRAAFEDCIANETPIKKVEMRMWCDAKRKEEGID